MKSRLLILLLVFTILLSGCMSSKPVSQTKTKIDLNKAVLLAQEAVNNKIPGYTVKRNLIETECNLINTFEIIGFPEKVYQNVWEIKLLPPKGTPREGIAQVVYLDADKGDVLSVTGYPFYYSGKNLSLNFSKSFSQEWRGDFLDGETPLGLEIIDKRGIEGFFKEFGNGSQISVKSIDITNELPLMFVDFDVQNVYLNGNTLIIKLKQDKKKVNVITIPYSNLKEKILGTYWISETGQHLGGTLFDDTIPEWVPDEIRWLKK